MSTSLSDIRNAVLLSLAAIVAGMLVPGYPFVGMPIAAFALGWIAYRFGYLPSAGLAVVAGVVTALVGSGIVVSMPLDAAYVSVALLALGPVAAWALQRYSAYAVAASITLGLTALFLLTPFCSEALSITVQTGAATFQDLAKAASGASSASYTAGAQQWPTLIKLIWPWLNAYIIASGVLLSVPIVSYLGRKSGRQTSVYPALADTDLTFHMVWPTIAGLIAVAAGLKFGGATGVLYAVGYNVLMLVRPALALQGMAVFAALYRKAGVKTFGRVVGYVLLVVTELLVPSVSVLGAADLFIDIRKLRKGAPQPA